MLICVLVMCCAGLRAQSQSLPDPYAAQKARIREIKLSSDYYYADVSSADKADATAMAQQLVVMRIQEQEQHAEAVAGLVKDSCRYIHLMRIDRPRVFAYISKETVAQWLLGPPAPAQPSAGVPADTVVPAKEVVPAVVVADSNAVAEVADSSAKAVVAGPVPVPADTVTVADRLPVAPADTVAKVPVVAEKVVVRDTVKVTVVDTMKVTLRDTVKVTVADTVRRRVEVRTTGNARLDRITAMQAIAEVQAYFVAEKKAGRMMFGKMDSALHPEDCYLLVFNREGKVLAVLDKGQQSRLNFRTGRPDSAEHYRGNGLIWFVLY